MRREPVKEGVREGEGEGVREILSVIEILENKHTIDKEEEP